MIRLFLMIAVAVLVAGCNKKPNAAATGGKPADQTEPTDGQSPPKVAAKKQEPLRLQPRHRIKTGIREVSRVVIADDGSRVAASSDGLGNRPQIEVWDLSPEPKKIRQFAGVLRALSADGKLLARPAKDNGASEIVDATTGAAISVIPDAGSFMRFTSPDRLIVVRPTETGPATKGKALVVGIYNVRTGKRESGFEIPSPDHADVRGLVNEGREIVVGWGKTFRVEVWDLATGKMLRGVTLADVGAKGGWFSFEASPNGKWVSAQRRMDRPVALYDTSTGTEVATIGNPTSVAFVPGRDLVLEHSSWVGEKFQTYNGWRARSLTAKAIVAELPGSYLFPAVSSDGRFMATMVARAAADVLVWVLPNPVTGRQVFCEGESVRSSV